MGSLASFLQGGGGAPAPVAAKKKQASSLADFLGVQQPAATPAAPVPAGVKTFKTDAGNLAYKTPSGTTHEFLPDGTKKVSLASQFGGGVYLVDPKNTGRVINQGHTTYGGVPAEPGMNRDDIVPVSLGGVNTDKNNINVVPKSQNPAALETKLASDVKAGKISKQQAQTQILSYKQNKDLSQTTAGNFVPAIGSTLANFARALAKPFVETTVGLVNEGRNIQGAIKGVAKGDKVFRDYSDTSYKVPLYGESGQNFTGKEKPLTLARKAGGAGIEIATYFLALPEVKSLENTLKVVGTKPIQELTAKEISTFAKAYSKKILLSSSTLGTLFGTGQTLQEENPTIKKLATNILKSGATIALMETTLTPILNKLLIKNPGKTLNEVTTDLHLNTPEPKVNLVDVPGVGKLPKEIPFEGSKAVDPEVLKNYKPVEKNGVVSYELNTKAPMVEKVTKPKTELDQLSEHAQKQSSQYSGDRAPQIQKGVAMEFAAIKRGIENKPTSIEFKNAKKYLESYYNGKEIKVGDQKGVVTNVSFGKVGVKFEDGSKKFFTSDKIPSQKVNSKDVLGYIQKQAQTKFDNYKMVYPEFKAIKETATPKVTTGPKMVQAKALSKVSESIQAKSLENSMLKSGFNELAGYDPITIKDQAQKVSDLINKDASKARAMVRGEVPLPASIREASLITGMEDYAMSKGDVSLMRELAKSPLVSQTSRHAQELRILAERNPESGVGQIIALQRTREAALVRRSNVSVEKTVSREVKNIKAEIAKTAPKVQDWASFVDKLKCT